MRDYVKEWQRLNLGEPIEEFKRKINMVQITDLINESFISPKRQQAFINLINRRFKGAMRCHLRDLIKSRVLWFF